jgi:hypothetical protein
MRRTLLIFGMTASVLGVLICAAVPASASSVPSPVTIDTLRSATDTWSASGAIVDSGGFIDTTAFFAGSSSTLHVVRVFSGEDGTFTAVGNVRILPSTDPDIAFLVVGRWSVTDGSGEYVDLHGGGIINEEYVVASDSLVGMWTGSVLFA